MAKSDRPKDLMLGGLRVNGIVCDMVRQSLEEEKSRLAWVVREISLLEKRATSLRATIEAGERFLAGVQGVQVPTAARAGAE
jgi:hypothetical protein